MAPRKTAFELKEDIRLKDITIRNQAEKIAALEEALRLAKSQGYASNDADLKIEQYKLAETRHVPAFEQREIDRLKRALNRTQEQLDRQQLFSIEQLQAQVRQQADTIQGLQASYDQVSREQADTIQALQASYDQVSRERFGSGVVSQNFRDFDIGAQPGQQPSFDPRKSIEEPHGQARLSSLAQDELERPLNPEGNVVLLIASRASFKDKGLTAAATQQRLRAGNVEVGKRAHARHGASVCQIFTMERIRRSRDGILHMPLIRGTYECEDEVKLFWTLEDLRLQGKRVIIYSRGIDGITNEHSLIS